MGDEGLAIVEGRGEELPPAAHPTHHPPGETFVELDRTAIQAIERNLQKLGLTGAEVVRGDAAARVAADARRGSRYDLVLIDPPYRMLDDALTRLSSHLPAIVSPGGLVVVESDAREEPELELALRTTRRYGSTRLTLFEA